MAAGTGQHARHHEQQVGQPVQVLQQVRTQRFTLMQRDHAALAAAADGACQMALGRRHAAAGQNEVAQRRQVGIERIQLAFQSQDIL